ncbi:hypothetical protein [Pseudomonas tohonis]|uniref:hypothetical protein n=1 Tax=Pseudomonas tohonis TaxID=2725477 RepID=UPI0022EFF042|nr:hypothetical protein [Pseudomonas tohonis]
MAKYTLTIEDGVSGVTVSLDKSNAPLPLIERPSVAGLLAQQMVDMVEMDRAIRATPAHRLMSPPPTLQ